MKSIWTIGKIVLTVLLAVFVISCGGDSDGGSGNVTTYKTADYNPLGQGDTWKYTEVTGTRTETVIKTVNGTEKVNGVEAVKLIYNDGDIDLWTSDANGITLYGSYNGDDRAWERFNPPLNILPGEVSVGTNKHVSSTVIHTDSDGKTATGTISMDITVEGVEDVTVTAGTFKNCLKIKSVKKVSSSDGSYTELDKYTFWFAKGVGEVKENGDETETYKGEVENYIYTDELVSATVGGVSY